MRIPQRVRRSLSLIIRTTLLPLSITGSAVYALSIRNSTCRVSGVSECTLETTRNRWDQSSSANKIVVLCDLHWPS